MLCVPQCEFTCRFTDVNINAHPDPNANGSPDAHSNPNAAAGGDPNSNANAAAGGNPNSHADTAANGNTDTNTDATASGNINADADTTSDGHSDADATANGDPDSDANPNVKAASLHYEPRAGPNPWASKPARNHQWSASRWEIPSGVSLRVSVLRLGYWFW